MTTALQAAVLPDRGVIKVSGDDSRHFLNGLVTIDIAKMTPGAARFGALLTPQGKIVVDFMIYEAPESDGGGYFVDCPRALAATLVEKLGFYKLRAKVAIEDLSELLEIMATWGGDVPDSEFGPTFVDPRLAAMGARVILPKEVAAEAAADLGATLVDVAAYHRHRTSLGVPQGGLDFIYGDAFPHEADMDQLAGVDFDKGCYVGQEVVSRVEHRSSARGRIVAVGYGEFAPQAGTDVMAGEKTIGQLTSIAPGRGIAMLRLDRLDDALAAGVPITCGGLPARPFRPEWARFKFPGEMQAAQ